MMTTRSFSSDICDPSATIRPSSEIAKAVPRYVIPSSESAPIERTFLLFISTASTMKSSSFITTVSKMVACCDFTGTITSVVLSIIRLIVWVMPGGAWSIRVTVTIPVAIEVTKLTRSVSKTICILLSSSICIMTTV